MTLQEKKQRYVELGHAMQTGVLQKMLQDRKRMGNGNEFNEKSDAGSKHLRTGVNMAFIDSGAIALCLYRKGIITEDEYMDAAIELLEKEVRSYEKLLTELLGVSITLG